jgi:DNA-binding SARP family transcriptional activator
MPCWPILALCPGGRAVGRSPTSPVSAHARYPREELAGAIWSEQLPPAWDTALRVLLSKLRAVFGSLGLAGSELIASAAGCYHVRLPPGTWIDIEAAAASIDEAEGAARAKDILATWGPLMVATVIARRTFLPGEEGDWVERQRARMHGIHLRALDCLADIRLLNGEGALAVETATEAVSLEPYRETGYQRLMRIHARLGNRAEALRVYEQCRRLLAAELGADPSPETEAVYLELLRG